MYLYNLTVLLGCYEKNDDHSSQITELFVIGFIHSVFNVQTALSAGLVPMSLKGKLRLSTFKSFAQRAGQLELQARTMSVSFTVSISLLLKF